MKKEVFLAVLVGFGLGLVITFGIWTANKNLKPSSPSAAQTISPSPAVPTPAQNQATSAIPLIITTPDQDEMLVNSNQLTLSGKTQPGSTVSVIHETGQQILVADSAGIFSLDLTLEGGYNRISVRAFDTNGNFAAKDLLITYSSTKI
jgi:hypothetical protein